MRSGKATEAGARVAGRFARAVEGHWAGSGTGVGTGVRALEEVII